MMGVGHILILMMGVWQLMGRVRFNFNDGGVAALILMMGWGML